MKKLKSGHINGIIAVCVIVLLVLVKTEASPHPKIDVSIFDLPSVPPQAKLAQVSPTATFNLSPISNSISQNQTFTVNIVLNTGGQSIYGVDINKIHFNPAILQVVDTDSSAAGVQITPGTLMSQVFVNTVDNTAGTIQFSQVATPPNTYSGSGTLATITFKGIAAGTSNGTIDFTLGSGTDSNIAGANGDLLTSVAGGSYTVVAGDTTVPTAPGTPTLTVISATQINLSWTASTDNVAVTGYRIERCSGSATCTNWAQVGTSAGTTYNDTTLTAGTIYRYQVRAVDAVPNLSTYSGAANATTLPPPDVTPPTISNIGLSGITTSGVTISWSTNEQSDTQVEYGLTTSYGSNSTLNTTLATAHSAALTSLSPGTSYHYRVKSKDAVGNPGVSLDNIFTTAASPDTTAPSVPTGVSATPTSDSEIQLSWTASTDPAGVGQNVSGVASYEVYRGGTLLTTTASTAYLDKNLNGGTSYSYQILAIDTAGNSSLKSTAVTATTPTLSLSVQRRITLVLEGAPATKRDVVGIIEFLNPTSLTKVYQASVTTDSFGKYLINVPSGLISTVSMRAVIPGYLPKLISNIDLRDSAVVDVTFPSLLAGDFDNNKLINSLDFSYLNSKWAGPDALADVNRDGEVNTLDFAFLSKNWLVAGE